MLPKYDMHVPAAPHEKRTSYLNDPYDGWDACSVLVRKAKKKIQSGDGLLKRNESWAIESTGSLHTSPGKVAWPVHDYKRTDQSAIPRNMTSHCSHNSPRLTEAALKSRCARGELSQACINGSSQGITTHVKTLVPGTSHSLKVPMSPTSQPASKSPNWNSP